MGVGINAIIFSILFLPKLIKAEKSGKRLDGGLREESHLEEGSTLERLQSASGNFGGPGVHLPSD